jgi:membrane associated rhomboid family serine protease
MNYFADHRNDDGWFRVGTVEVTTTVLLTALGLLSLLIYVVFPARVVVSSAGADYQSGGALLTHLMMLPDKVRGLQLWRLVSWPLANVPDQWFWSLLNLFFFFVFGSATERSFGKRRYLWLLGYLTIILGLVALAVNTPVAGLDLIAFGVFAAFVVSNLHARTFFNLPLWGLALFFLAINVLQYLTARSWPQLLLLLLSVGLGVLAARAAQTSDLEAVPALPLPGLSPTGRTSPPRSKRRAPRGPATVTPIRRPPEPDEALAEMEVDMLLDKVAATGLDSLTPEERRTLERHAKRKGGRHRD